MSESSPHSPSQPLVHLEFSAEDPEALAVFYSDLFDWPFMHDQAHDYRISMAGRGGISVGIAQRSDDLPPGLMPYVHVPAVQPVLEQAVALGAAVVSEATVIDGMEHAVVADPDGHRLGLMFCAAPCPDDGAPASGMPPHGGQAVVHVEIAATKLDAEREFYSQLFGWTFQRHEPTGYLVAMTGEAEAPTEQSANQPASLGMMQACEQMPPYVTAYVAVDDPAAGLERAAALGAQVVMPVHTIDGVGDFGMFVDPQGHLMAVAKFVPMPDAAPETAEVATA